MSLKGPQKITSLRNFVGEGVFSLVTNDEYVVVNGVLASPFGISHFWPNLYYNLHRLIFAINPKLVTYSIVRNMGELLNTLRKDGQETYIIKRFYKD